MEVRLVPRRFRPVTGFHRKTSIETKTVIGTVTDIERVVVVQRSDALRLLMRMSSAYHSLLAMSWTFSH